RVVTFSNGNEAIVEGNCRRDSILADLQEMFILAEVGFMPASGSAVVIHGHDGSAVWTEPPLVNRLGQGDELTLLTIDARVPHSQNSVLRPADEGYLVGQQCDPPYLMLVPPEEAHRLLGNHIPESDCLVRAR